MKDELIREVRAVSESLRANAKAYWMKRRGRGMVVKRSIVTGAEELEAEGRARHDEGESEFTLGPTRIEENRRAHDRAAVTFWREVYLYIVYRGFFYGKPEKPDITIIED